MRRFWITLALILLLAAACGPAAGTSTPIETSAPTSPTATNVPTPTSTPVPAAVILVAPDAESEPAIAAIQSVLEGRARDSELRFDRILPEAVSEDIPESIALVVVYRPNQQLIERLNSTGVEPDQVVAVAPTQPASTEGVVTIGPDGMNTDQAAFLAGYTAAVLSENYRVAVVSAQGISPEGAADSFISGARYYCGLCRAAYPPFADYPASIRLDGSPESGDTASVIQRLQDLAIRSVYLAPDLEQSPLGSALAETNMNVLAQRRPNDFPEERWLAAIRPAPELAIEEQWNALLTGAAPAQISMPLLVTDRNNRQFTDARYRVVQEVLDELVAGYIGTRVDEP